MAYEEIVLQLILISFSVILFSQILNKLMGITPENMREIRDKATNLQQRISNVKAMGDFRMMQELQTETMRLMKSIVKKQVIPMCLRCIVFLGIWTVLGFIYADFGFGSDFFFGYGWFPFYFLLALGWSLSFYGLKKLYRKKSGKVDERRSFAREVMEMLNPRVAGGMQDKVLQQTVYPQTQQQSPSGQPSWQDRIHDNFVSQDSWKEKIKPPLAELSEETSRFCPKCGKSVDFEDRICEHCRADLTE